MLEPFVELTWNDPVGLAIEPKLYGTLYLKWSSVLERCCVTLQIRTQVLPPRGRISITSWYVPITQRNFAVH